MGMVVPFVGLFMVCLGMSMMFFLYLCLLWYASLRTAAAGATAGVDNNGNGVGYPNKLRRGLSEDDLKRLPGAGDGESVAGTECAVCLDDIEAGQSTRVLPSCGHAFHLVCADSWLLTNPACPLCRAAQHAPPPPPPMPVPPLPIPEPLAAA